MKDAEGVAVPGKYEVKYTTPTGPVAAVELMLADERASWIAEREQWKRERKALLEYFETERAAMLSETETAKLELEHVLQFLAQARAMRFEDGVPPSEEEVDDYLTYLKIDGGTSRRQLRWLAEEAMHAPLPFGWTAHRHPDTLEPYYYNRCADPPTSSYEHPIDDLCRFSAASLTNAIKKKEDARGVVACKNRRNLPRLLIPGTFLRDCGCLNQPSARSSRRGTVRSRRWSARVRRRRSA